MPQPALADTRRTGGAVLLAAGFARRFGSDKRLHPMPDGRPMALVTAARYQAQFPRLLVVVRPEDPVTAVLSGFEIVECADAELGMGHSLAAGAARAAGWDYLVVALADMPWIGAATLAHLQNLLEQPGPGAVRRIVQPVFRGTPGHPVGFAGAHIPALARCRGDAGARAVIDANAADLERFAVDDEGVVRDLDRA